MAKLRLKLTEAQRHALELAGLDELWTGEPPDADEQDLLALADAWAFDGVLEFPEEQREPIARALIELASGEDDVARRDAKAAPDCARVARRACTALTALATHVRRA